jgi:hypothetical protein
MRGNDDMQRAIHIEVGVPTFIAKIACRAVLTAVEVQNRGQLRVRRGATFVDLWIHRGWPVETWWWLDPHHINVVAIRKMSPNGQHTLEVRRVQLLTQCRLLTGSGEVFELPRLVSAGFDQVLDECHLQSLR